MHIFCHCKNVHNTRFSRTLISRLHVRRNIGDSVGGCMQYRLLEGGAETGFHHVKPEEYIPRLMHFCGSGKKVVVTQVGSTTRRFTQKSPN